MVDVRHARPDEWQALRDVRLRALADGAASLYRACGFEDDGPGELHDDRPTRTMRLVL